MICSVCNRNHTVSLSICPGCGSMMNDSVREELVGKISTSAKPIDLGKIPETMPNKKTQTVDSVASQQPAASSKLHTSSINTKLTSPTLVEFHSKNTTLPEWRLQLQNAVRQRQETARADIEIQFGAPRAQLVTSGANALKAEIIKEPQPVLHSNPDVARALQRIKDSRQKFLAVEEVPPTPTDAAPAPKTTKNYPFYIAAKTSDVPVKPAETNDAINSFAKPKLASSLKIKKEKLDTNKLPPLPQAAQISTEVASHSIVSERIETVVEETLKVKFEITKTEEIAAAQTIIVEAADDCPTFAMRFNAGLFDLIIGSFSSLILLAPFMLWGGNWASWGGLFAVLATCAVVMFIYLTTTIGLYGKTFGMRLFSLELIDIEGEEYPSFHQAAVNSALYLLSLPLGGIGFLTLPFNEDRRALHDLVSGTIVVKEEI